MSTQPDQTTTKRKGGRPPQPEGEKRKPVPIRLPPALITALDERRGGQSRNAWIEEAIRKKLGGADRPRAARSPQVAAVAGGGSKQQYTCPTHGTVNLGRCTTIGCTATQRPIR